MVIENQSVFVQQGGRGGGSEDYEDQNVSNNCRS